MGRFSEAVLHVFTGKRSTIALVVACAIAVVGGGSLWWNAPPTPGIGQQRAEAAVVHPGRRVHILEGDRTGGGHRPGRGLPGKSEFPPGWSDDRIIAAIEAVANDPASARRAEADGRTVVTGRRGGVDMRVVVERDGRSVVTGYPTNTPRNPER